VERCVLIMWPPEGALDAADPGASGFGACLEEAGAALWPGTRSASWLGDCGSGPDVVVLRWVTSVMACSEVTVVRRLRDGGSHPF
jgi:hypothetical protein